MVVYHITGYICDHDISANSVQKFLILFVGLVHFRYAVLRPFIDEVIVGKVRSSSPEGVNGQSI